MAYDSRCFSSLGKSRYEEDICPLRQIAACRLLVGFLSPSSLGPAKTASSANSSNALRQIRAKEPAHPLLAERRRSIWR
ncbi:uncharacterized protein [Panulirus ornatus]|uniref:uncharacterized protein isoform X7 n=1 Tax=Panulirus ornatus TaxID=150431 RepID=UPI003A8A4B76